MDSRGEMLSILSALMSPDNVRRSSAEQLYTARIQANLFLALEDLIAILRDVTMDLHIRSLSGVLLRRLMCDFMATLDAKGSAADLTNILSQFRVTILDVWTHETNKIILKRLGHIISQVSSQERWPELLPKMISHVDICQSDVVTMSTIQFIEILMEYNPDEVTQSMNIVGNFLSLYLASSSLQVRQSTARAICACIVYLPDEACRTAFKQALPNVINILGLCLSNGDEVDATSMMEYLVDIAEMHPTFFKGCLDTVVDAMIATSSSTRFDYSTRSMALEVVVTIAENSPAMLRKSSKLVKAIVSTAMTFLLEVEQDDGEWSREKYTEDQSDDAYLVGEEAIERLTTGLGGKIMIPLVAELVQQYAQSQDSKHRRASVAALVRLAEGATSSFKSSLENSINLLSVLANDSSLRVQYEIINATGRLAALYSDMIERFIATFMPYLLSKFQDVSMCDKIRGHAVSAMINLCNPESCEASFLIPFMEPILQAIVVALQSSSVEVRIPCLTLIGCLAQSGQSSFVRYYSALMPGIKDILFSVTGIPDLATYCGKTIECIGLIAESVGMKTFAPDANDIIEYIMKSLSQDGGHDNDFDYILPACARISKAMGSHFQPLLPRVMELILNGANQTTNFSMVDADDDEVEGEVLTDEDTGMETTVVSFGVGVKKRVSMNTHAVQQKNQAARMIYDFAANMKGYLCDYLPHCLECLLTLAKDKHSADIRSSSILAVAKIFDCYIHAVQSNLLSMHHLHRHQAQTTQELLQNVSKTCIDQLCHCLHSEINITVKACLTETIRDILTSCYTSGQETIDGKRIEFLCLPDIHFSSNILTNLILNQCQDTLTKRNLKVQNFLKNENYDIHDDQDFLEESLEDEDDLLSNLVDIFGQLLKLHGAAYMAVFQQRLLPAFAPYFASNQPTKLQILSICLLDDAIEFGNGNIEQYIPQLVPILEGNMFAEDLVLRQCSVYGIAQFILHHSSNVLLTYMPTIVPKLIQLIQFPAAKDEENIGITENAIFALGSLYINPIYQNALIPMNDQLVGMWLHALPLKADEIEAKISAVQLCQLIEHDFRICYDYFCDILRIICEVLVNKLSSESKEKNEMETTLTDSLGGIIYAHPSIQEKMQSILRQMISSVPSDKLQCAVANLSVEQRSVLQQFQ